MKPKWQPIVKARTSVLFQWYVQVGHGEEYFWEALKIKAGLKNGKIVTDEIFIDLNEWAKLEKILVLHVQKDKQFLKRFIKLCYQYSYQLIKTSKLISQTQNWQQLKKDKLLSYYNEYQNSILKLMPFLNSVLVLDNVLKKEIVRLLESELGVKNKNEQDLLLSKLVIPNKKSFFVQETEALLKMALKLQKDKGVGLEQDIKDYLKKFAWMSSIAYLGNFQNEKDLIQKLNELIKENPGERVEETKRIRNETKASFDEAFTRIKKSPELVKLIDLAREFIYLQTYRLDVFFVAHYYAHVLLKAIGKNLGLTVNELVYLTGKEIIELLNEKSKVNKNEISRRMKNYALIQEEGEFTLLSGSQVKKATPKTVKELMVKGTVANRGRATGRAKLVYEVKDIPKVNRGDIIVSPMTHPNLVPAIIKASGIITDFGGMLCHAAIISREFGIPCIVDTKKATKVFKDNDLVELNAYDGVARKLK